MIIFITASTSSNTHTIKLLDVRIGHLEEQHQCLASHRFCCETCGVCVHHSQVSPINLKNDKHFQKQKQLDPIIPEQTNHPVSMILLSCEEQQFVSCTSNLLEQMCGSRRCIMFLQKWILNLQDLPQNQSPKTVPICIVWQFFPHDNIVCIHLCDECMKSIDSSVCHKLFGPFFDGSWELIY